METGVGQGGFSMEICDGVVGFVKVSEERFGLKVYLAEEVTALPYQSV